MTNATATRLSRQVRIIGHVIAERERQEHLHGDQSIAGAAARAETGKALAILTEEVLEVTREALEAMSHEQRIPGVKVRDTANMVRLRVELVQVAAVAVAWIEAIDVEYDA